MEEAKNEAGESVVIITINVGGTQITTTKATLQHIPMFKMLLKKGAKAYDVLFLDRDVAYFNVLLNYVRSGILALPSHLIHTQFEIECAYFGIDLHKEDFGQDENAKSKKILHDQWMYGKPGAYRELVCSGGFIAEYGGEVLCERDASDIYKFNQKILPIEFREEPKRDKAIKRLLDHFLKYGWQVQEYFISDTSEYRSFRLRKQ